MTIPLRLQPAPEMLLHCNNHCTDWTRSTTSIVLLRTLLSVTNLKGRYGLYGASAGTARNTTISLDNRVTAAAT
jgi:hypothetical protein